MNITPYTARTIATYRATSRQLRRLDRLRDDQHTPFTNLQHDALTEVCADAWRVIADAAPRALRLLLAEDATLIALGERRRQGLPVAEQLVNLREIRAYLAPYTRPTPLAAQFARAFAAGFLPVVFSLEVARVA